MGTIRWGDGCTASAPRVEARPRLATCAQSKGARPHGPRGLLGAPDASKCMRDTRAQLPRWWISLADHATPRSLGDAGRTEGGEQRIWQSLEGQSARSRGREPHEGISSSCLSQNCASWRERRLNPSASGTMGQPRLAGRTSPAARLLAASAARRWDPGGRHEAQFGALHMTYCRARLE